MKKKRRKPKKNLMRSKMVVKKHSRERLIKRLNLKMTFRTNTTKRKFCRKNFRRTQMNLKPKFNKPRNRRKNKIRLRLKVKEIKQIKR